MATRFAIGVVVGGLLALTPFLLPAVLVVGAWVLFTSGLEPPGDGATAGVLWISAWATVLTAILIGLTILILGLWGAPRATLTGAGTLLVLATVHRRMKRNRGGADGPV